MVALIYRAAAVLVATVATTLSAAALVLLCNRTDGGIHSFTTACFQLFDDKGAL